MEKEKEKTSVLGVRGGVGGWGGGGGGEGGLRKDKAQTLPPINGLTRLKP